LKNGWGLGDLTITSIKALPGGRELEPLKLSLDELNTGGRKSEKENFLKWECVHEKKKAYRREHTKQRFREGGELKSDPWGRSQWQLYRGTERKDLWGGGREL